MSTLKVNVIQSNTTSELDINSPLGTIPSLDVTGSTTIGGNLNAVGVITARNFTGNLSGNITGTINSSGVSTFSGGVVISAGTTSAPSISPSGDSNTGIFFPSPDTVAIAEGGVEALRVDSSSNIGINSTSPARKLDVVDSGASGSVIRSRVTTNNGGYLAYEALNSSGTSVFSVTHNGRINLSENIVFASGQGLDFSATANSSGTMTSELLNDYEEGTFTPFFAAGTVSGGYTTQTGTYVKIGRLVTFSLIIDGNGNLQGAAQGIQIGGLPFTAQPGVAQLGGAYIVANQSFDITNNRRFWYASGTVLVYTDASGNVVNGNAVNNVNSDLYLTGQYFTAS